MKQLLILLMVCFVGVGCSMEGETQQQVINGQGIYTYVIDGCQYIGKIHGTNSDILTHNGNCNNHIHNHK